MRLAALALATAAITAPAIAQDASPGERAHALRSAHMSLYAANLGPLVGMARGEIPFDADMAALRAGNIAAYSSANILPYFVEGSSSEDVPDSRALPIIWQNVDDVAAKHAALNEAARAVAAAAPQGQEAFNAAFPSLGQACGNCHETYRRPDD